MYSRNRIIATCCLIDLSVKILYNHVNYKDNYLYINNNNNNTKWVVLAYTHIPIFIKITTYNNNN